MYVSFIRPILEYCDTVWDGCTQNECKKLEEVQLAAARVVSGALRGTSHSVIYNELGWETLSERRIRHKLIMFYKMVNGLCPTSLTALVPPTVGSEVNYSLRDVSSIRNVSVRTELRKKSFLYSTIELWNNLCEQTRNAITLSSFIDKISSSLKKPQLYYNCMYSRKAQVYHSRLRMGCSSLNYHLFVNHCLEDPKCQCGASCETPKHYFFECASYEQERSKLFDVFQGNNLTTEILLYGNNECSNEENQFLFKHVQRYIDETNRF